MSYSTQPRTKKEKTKSIVYDFMMHYVSLIVIVVTVIIATVALLGNYFYYESKEENLRYRAKEVAKIINFYMGKNNYTELYQNLSLAEKLADADIWIFDGDRDVTGVTGFSRSKSDVRTNLAKFKSIPQDDMTESPLLFDTSELELSDDFKSKIDEIRQGKYLSGVAGQPFYGESVLYAAAPFNDPLSGKTGAVFLAVPMSHYTDFMNIIYASVFFCGLVALLLALAWSRHLSKSLALPITNSQEFALKLASGKYGEQIPEAKEVEIAGLTKALNVLSRDLANYTDSLDRKERIRRDFVANVSHELKTPITIIRGYNDALSEGLIKDPEKIHKYRAMINDETIRIENMVKNLLNVSRLENADPWHIDQLEPLPLAELIEKVSERLFYNALNNNVKIKIDADESLRVYGDGDQLIQLILILMDNALKYSPQNGILLVSAHREENGSVSLSIKDQGPGISEEDLPYIWDRFYKADKSRNRKKVPGTGLGLAIAKQIIRVHGAQANVMSKPGEGTEFIITFPKDKIV